MRIRVVDYIANLGGGVRFSVECIQGLLPGRDVSIDVVSYGPALHCYRELLSEQDGVRFLEIPPANRWRARGLTGFRGAGRMNTRLGLQQFHFNVPEAAFDGCDVVWLPWLHRHRVPRPLQDRAVASLHDVIMLQFPGLVRESWRRDEHETVRTWLASTARIAVSSNSTAESLVRIFGCTLERVRVIPLSGEHCEKRVERGAQWPFNGRPFLLYPANTMPHKNHEVLFAGAGEASTAHPLVLTGTGTDFWLSGSARAQELRRCARIAGFEWNRSLFGLGYVADQSYYELLEHAWALVVPTLAEGGGSFPVAEALQGGIPVIASDIPVMREWVKRMAGQVLWFDPSSPKALAAALAELEQNYPTYKKAALAQIATLRTRSWVDVATDYADLMRI